MLEIVKNPPIPKADAIELYEALEKCSKARGQSVEPSPTSYRQLLEGITNQIIQSKTPVVSNKLQDRLKVIRKLFAIDRRLNNWLHLSKNLLNKLVHDETQKLSFEIRQEQAVICTIASLIYAFSGVEIPKALAGFDASGFYNEPGTEPAIAPITATISLKGILTGKAVKRKGDGSNDHVALYLTLEEYNQEVVIYCYHHQARNAFNPDNNLIEQSKLLYENCKLYLHYLKKSEHQVEGLPLYTTSIKTQIVLEPDLLLDASDLASCLKRINPTGNVGQSPSYVSLSYFLKKMTPISHSLNMLMGNAVNTIMEAAIQGKRLSEEDVYEALKKANLIYLIQYGEQEVKGQIKEVLEANQEKFEILVEDYFRKRDFKPYQEVSFVSARYGIQGRLDILAKKVNSSKPKYEIYELKSGRMPNQSFQYGKDKGAEVWPEHAYQVTAYQALLLSVYDKEELEDDSEEESSVAQDDSPILGQYVIYSKADEKNMVRIVQMETKVLQLLMQVRNEIVCKIYYLAQDIDGTLAKVVEKSEGIARYSEESAAGYKALLYGASEDAILYYRTFLAFQLRELICAKIGLFGSYLRESSGFSDLWTKKTEEKKLSYQIIPLLALRAVDAEERMLSFDLSRTIEHSFRQGDGVVLYQVDNPNNHHPEDNIKQQLLKGELVEITAKEFKVQLRNAEADFEELEKYEGFYYLEIDHMDSGDWSLVRGLYHFLEANPDRQQLLLGMNAPGLQSFAGEILLAKDKNLTPTQLHLVQEVLNAKDYYLLQGPPGTGKTSTVMMTLVKTVLANYPEKKVTILALTNRAVDEVAHNLEKNDIPFIQLGGRTGEGANRISQLIERMTVGELKTHFENTRVIIATVHTYTNRMYVMKSLLPQDFLLVDEASQLTETQLVGIVAGFEKFVLIGDHKQLPSVIIQDDSYTEVKHEGLRKLGFTSLRQSFFERLWTQCESQGWHHAIGTLTDHFRMHRHVADYVNHFYANQLREFSEVQRLPLQPYLESGTVIAQMLNSHRVVFVNFEEAPQPKISPEEANFVCDLIRELATSKEAYEVGVIAPWKAQIAQINAQLSSRQTEWQGAWSEAITVDTVERYQGLEKDIIIISTALDHQYRGLALESLDPTKAVDRKLNVAISRAKMQVVILGNARLLSKLTWYRSLITSIKADGAYYEYNQLIELNP